MPDGYLVQLGDPSLDVGDAIVDPLLTFTTAQTLGTGNWEWSGIWNGSTFTNEPEPGTYYLATDGNVYFEPSFGPVDTLTSASVTAAPAFTTANVIVGTPLDDDPLDGTRDEDDIDGLSGADDIDAGAGDDTVLGGAGNDEIDGGTGEDSINAGDGDDTVSGGDQDDELYGGSGGDDIFGDGGADLLLGGSGSDALFGGSGDDTIYGDQQPGSGSNETLRWSDVGDDEDDVSGGFTVTTGLMDVSVSFVDNGALTSAEIDTGSTQYTETGEAFGTNSALELAGDGGANTVTTTISFAAAADTADDTDISDSVANVSFRLNDIDTGSWEDTVTVNAFDANGNPVTVTLSPEDSANTTGGNTVYAGVSNGSAASQSGSVLVEIDGPVQTITVIYGNNDSGGQRAWLTDVNFDTTSPADGDDTLDGGTGADDMFGGGGDDTFNVAHGDEAYGEAGDDLFVISDLGEAVSAITIDGGSGDETLGDTIQLNGEAGLDDVVFNVGDPRSGTITLTDGTIVTFSNVENIICFTPGALVSTPFGPRPIETLDVGDYVLTRDRGPQPIRWIGMRTVRAEGAFAPIELGPGAFPGATTPLLLSPQHRLLLSGYRAELLFGEREVLVAAKHLVNGIDIRESPRAEVTYIHVMFDRHEIISANGIETESFFAGDQSLFALEGRARSELFEIFPELRAQAPGPLARRSLKAYEAALLCSGRAPDDHATAA